MWVFGVIGIKLPAPQKFSCGPFGSDGCWLGSTAPGLQMRFGDCFHPLLETQGQIRNWLFFLGIQPPHPTPPPPHTHTDANTSAQHTTFRLTSSPSFWRLLSGGCTCTHNHAHPDRKYHKLYLLAPRQFPSKEKKDVENDWSWKPFNSHTPTLPPHLHPAILSPLYSMLIKSGRALLSLGGISGLV